MGKFRKFTHAFVVHCLVVSLTIWSLPPKVEAQDILEGDNLPKALIGATQMIGKQMMNVKMQNAAMMQQAQIMSQLQPKLVPARFFPQCQVPQAFNAPPEGVCDQVQNPMQLGAMMGYQQLAHKYDDMYTKMSSPAQNTPFPQGLQCIEEAAKKTDADMQAKLNTLTAFQTKMRKQMQLFRDQNKKLKDEMDGINQELNGGRSNNVDTKKGDLASSFSPQCANMLGGPSAMNNLGQGKGLLGLQKTMDQTVRGAANDFTANQATYKKDIDALVGKMVKKMNNDGIDNFDLTAKDIRGIDGDMVQRVSETFQGEVASLKKFRDQIAGDIKRTGIDFDMPRFDKNFKVDFEEFRAGAKTYYQKQYVHECVTGAGSTSLGLTAEQILSGLQQKGIRGSASGNSVSRYRERLQNILATDSMIEDKLAEIKALDNEFSGRGAVTVTYQDTKAQTATKTPYELYMETVNACQQQFSQNQTFAGSAQGVSAKKKVERVQGYLDQLKKKHDAFVADAANSITDSLINCNGAKLKSAPGMCGKDAMSPKGKGFCMAHAQQCVGHVNKCYNEVKSRVEQKTTQLKSKADMYNKNVGTLVAQQQAILKEVQRQVTIDSEMIKNFFPGANYTVPKDMFIQMPPIVGANDPSNKYGVDLIGGGDITSLEELPKKIEFLKQQLSDQKTKIQGVIKKYASEQGGAIKQNQSKWKAFGAKCKATEKAFRQQVAQADAQKAADAAKKRGEVKNFCDKYKRLKNLSPAAGCGKVEGLYEDSNKIAAHLNGDVLGSLDAYTNVCEGRDSKDGEDEDKTPKIAKMCDRKSWDEIKKQTLDNLIAKLPGDISSHASKIKSFVTDGVPERLSDISKDVANSDYADYILNAQKLHELRAQGETPAGKLDTLAKRLENSLESVPEDKRGEFSGLIKNFGSAESKERATGYLNSILSKAGASTSGSGSGTDPNASDIAALQAIITQFNDGALPQVNLDTISTRNKPSGMQTAFDSYEAARTALEENKQTLNTSTFTYKTGTAADAPTATQFFSELEVLKANGEIASVSELTTKLTAAPYNIPANDVAAKVSTIINAPAVRGYKQQRSKLLTEKGKFVAAMQAHKGQMENNPFADLIQEAELAKADVEKMPDDLTRAPASEGDSDICKNIETEIENEAKEICSDRPDGQKQCINDKIAELEVNEDNGVSSKLTTTSKANRILTQLDQGRGIASAQEWSNIGENSSDACESTAANGRSFGGIDLGEFDMATGASPLGLGAAQ